MCASLPYSIINVRGQTESVSPDIIDFVLDDCLGTFMIARSLSLFNFCLSIKLKRLN